MIQEAVGTASLAGVPGSVSALFKVVQCSSTKTLNIFQQYLMWLAPVPCDAVSEPGSGKGAEKCDAVPCFCLFEFFLKCKLKRKNKEKKKKPSK